MLIQRQPNSWSCLPTAVAMVLDISVMELISKIGHDGSAEWTQDLDIEEPECKVGFQVYELVDACLELGYAMIPIAANPTTIFRGQEITCMDEEKSMKRLMNHINKSQGILFGQGKRHGHVVANSFGLLIDPNGQSYSIEKAPEHGFNQIEVYARIEPIIKSE